MTCSAIKDEMAVAFDDILELKGNSEQGFDVTALHSPWERSEWQSVPVLNATQKVVCRTSNRMFVGLPLCMPFFLVPERCNIADHHSRPRP